MQLLSNAAMAQAFVSNLGVVLNNAMSHLRTYTSSARPEQQNRMILSILLSEMRDQ